MCFYQLGYESVTQSDTFEKYLVVDVGKITLYLGGSYETWEQPDTDFKVVYFHVPRTLWISFPPKTNEKYPFVAHYVDLYPIAGSLEEVLDGLARLIYVDIEKKLCRNKKTSI